MRLVAPPPTVPLAPGKVPTFSVIIAVYQSASTIGGAVASALAQTYPALEVIVCDDGSTADVEGALAQYGDRILLLRKENGGGASALNQGARVARGDFLAILDADDVYDPSRIEALGRLAAARPDLDVVTTDAYYELNGKRLGRFHDTTPFPVTDQRAQILRSCFACAPAVRRTRVLASGGWDESLRIGYDWDCWLRLILDGACVGLVDEPLMSYRLHAGSLTSNRLESFRARVRLLEKARGNATLTRRERRILAASIAWQRSRFEMEQLTLGRANGRSATVVRQVARARIRQLVAQVRFAGPVAALRSQIRRRKSGPL
jgi:glycosyltransferase involved in cell wall biosynthesis